MTTRANHAERAWKSKKREFTSLSLKAVRAGSKGQYMVVMPRGIKYGKTYGHFKVLVFPKPEHFSEFKRAAAGTTSNGPSQEEPKAVGTLYFNVNRDSKTVWLDYAQAHFRSATQSKSSTHAYGDKEKKLDRKLVTYYGGWREHAFEHAIRLAHANGYELNNNKPRFNAELKQAAKKLGITPAEEGNLLRMAPPERREKPGFLDRIKGLFSAVRIFAREKA